MMRYRTKVLAISFLVIICIIAIVCLIYFSLKAKLKSDDGILVTLSNGQIRGREWKTNENVTIYSFQGIPYAAPPIGSLRFQAPEPVENWDGIWDATKDGADCINQDPENDNPKSEDCLFVNVYTPKLGTNTSNQGLLPVMFWIYGGGFNSGTSTYSVYGPDYLVEDNIVFVSFNYRLGPFGFLSTEDTVIPGNIGLKDQNLALKWTQQNIHLFGGDPDKVTIFGESAGSAAVIYQLLSEKSAGLFRGAIGMSGTALTPLLFTPNPKENALNLLYKIAENNNLVIDNSTLTSTSILEFFKNQTTESISTGDQQTKSERTNRPTIEVSHESAFLTESMFELLENGKFNQVPTIMGFTSEEYLYFMGSLENLTTSAKSYDENLENLIPSDFILQESANKSEVADAIKKIYLDSNQLFADNIGAALRYGSDTVMTRSIMKHTILQSNYTDVYFYEFSHFGNIGIRANYTIDGAWGKVAHSDELPYVFKMNYVQTGADTTNLTKLPTEDVLVLRRFIRLFTNFAKYLNPTPEAADLLQNITWPTVTNSGFQYLDIGENLEVVQGFPRENSFTPWNEIYTNYSVRPFYTF